MEKIPVLIDLSCVSDDADAVLGKKGPDILRQSPQGLTAAAKDFPPLPGKVLIRDAGKPCGQVPGGPDRGRRRLIQLCNGANDGASGDANADADAAGATRIQPNTRTGSATAEQKRSVFWYLTVLNTTVALKLEVSLDAG